MPTFKDQAEREAFCEIAMQRSRQILLWHSDRKKYFESLRGPGNPSSPVKGKMTQTNRYAYR